jgi:hypothetical protein
MADQKLTSISFISLLSHLSGFLSSSRHCIGRAGRPAARRPAARRYIKSSFFYHFAANGEIVAKVKDTQPFIH